MAGLMDESDVHVPSPSKEELAVITAFIVVLIAIFVWLPPSLHCATPPPICEFPKPHSDKSVKFQEEKVKICLGLKETSDDLETKLEQVSEASTAGDTCSDSELPNKMKPVGRAAAKVKERVLDIIGGFQNGAKKTLAELKSVWNFVAKGEMEKALHQLQSVRERTELLAKQVDSRSMKHEVGEIHRALDALRSYYKRAKEKHEKQKHQLKEEKQDHTESVSAALRSVMEAEEMARGAEANAQKELKELEKLKAQNIAFESDDQNPFKKHRAKLLKQQQTYEAQAENHRRTVFYSQSMIARIEEQYEVENAAFKCIDNAVTRMNEAFDEVSMPTMNFAMFEQDLKKDYTDLVNEIKSAGSLSVRGDLCRVCNKAKRLFVKWRALLNVSEDYYTA